MKAGTEGLLRDTVNKLSGTKVERILGQSWCAAEIGSIIQPVLRDLLHPRICLEDKSSIMATDRIEPLAHPYHRSIKTEALGSRYAFYCPLGKDFAGRDFHADCFR